MYRLDAEHAIVETVDFFTPVVDDPYWFGRIAAANAFSDVWAMGGRPLFALNVVGWPVGKLPMEQLGEVLRGGAETARLAGASILGGHSIDDPEPKYGLAVTGLVHPDRILRNVGARPGDALVLTKPLGSGIATTAVKRELATPALLERVTELLAALNRAAGEVLAESGGVHALTDVTGFGLLGHASHIARASDVTLHIEVARVPLLPGARAAWKRGARTGGAERNVDWLETRVAWGATPDAERALLVDPQTSGGLLLAMPSSSVAAYVSRVPDAVEIGAVEPRGATDIALS